MPIPVIDIFAGPGGLGEGFSAPLLPHQDPKFKIGLSIEMDEYAHQTLELRAFLREFSAQEYPNEYYDYLADPESYSRNKLFDKYPDAAGRARNEAWCATLGKTDPNEVHKRIREAVGDADKWVLIGGPPCQAYSLVGRSRRINDPTFAEDEKHFLYRQYLRILAVHKPPVFVMENVKGLLSAKVKEEGIFKQILNDLAKPLDAMPNLCIKGVSNRLSYRLMPLAVKSGKTNRNCQPEDFVIRAEDFGIPQARHRIIILGVRSDIDSDPDTLENSEPITVEQAISDLPRLRSGLSKEEDSAEAWRCAIQEIRDSPWIWRRSFDVDLRDALIRATARVGLNLTRGGRFIREVANPQIHRSWFFDTKLKGVCNHETRGHIRTDLQRYFFAAVYAREKKKSPLLENFPKPLLPRHNNVEDALSETKFNDRFRVQLKNRPSTTVVSHIAKDGHYFIHYDSSQCRSLTVREAARLQTFPDNYFFEGPRTEQYRQVGNAVPPFLAKQIAQIVARLLE